MHSKARYYIPKNKSPLYAAIVQYNSLCDQYVERARAVVDRFGANSFVNTCDLFRIAAKGLRFPYAETPLSWKISPHGFCYPKNTDHDAAYFDFELPTFEQFYTAAPRGLSIGQLGETIVVFVPPTWGGEIQPLEAATLLDNESINDLKKGATPQQIAHFDGLGDESGAVLQISLSDVFKSSGQVENEKNRVNRALEGGAFWAKLLYGTSLGVRLCVMSHRAYSLVRESRFG